VAGGLSDDLVRAIGRQIDHARAVTDGESPYYAGNEWHADMWRIDNELIVADYLRRYIAEWSVRPMPEAAIVAAADEIIRSGYSQTNGILTVDALRYRITGIIARHVLAGASDQ
jgi:hypothetical protein